MDFTEFYGHYVQPYWGIEYIFDAKRGYIVWRVGTGENVEILHIRAFELRKGYATDLIRQFLIKIKSARPYYSVFGFMLATNAPVIAMYRKMGFRITEVSDLYKGGQAVLITQQYDQLCQNLGV